MGQHQLMIVIQPYLGMSLASISSGSEHAEKPCSKLLNSYDLCEFINLLIKVGSVSWICKDELQLKDRDQVPITLQTTLY